METGVQIPDDISVQEIVQQLLSKKEVIAEKFILDLISSMEKNNEPGTSADLSHQNLMEEAEKKFSDCSVILSHKYKPIIAEAISQIEHRRNQNRFAIIRSMPENEEILSRNYKKCFEAFINNEQCVSFKTGNPSMLKNIPIRDYFTLAFFAMNTNRRQKNDHLLQLLITGRNSSGKTILFEHVVQEVSHCVTADAGVGRFLQLNTKSTILLRDFDIEKLVKAPDVEKWKCIARTEPVTTKIHSKTNCINPMFLMGTSNKHLMTHRFAEPDSSGKNFRVLYKSDVASSKTIHEEDLSAMQSRFIECFVRERPTISSNYLPKSGFFHQKHAIVGLYKLVITTLMRFTKDDFYSDYLFLYCIGGLCKNHHMMPPNVQDALNRAIIHLMDQYELHADQRAMCLN